jgi:hypothetical protein
MESDGNMNPQINTIDFNERHFIAFREQTQACDLVCMHTQAMQTPKSLAASISPGIRSVFSESE